MLRECARVRLSARLSVRRGAVCGAAGAAHRSRNESGHPGRQCRRLPVCPSRRAGHAPTWRQSSPGKDAQSQGTPDARQVGRRVLSAASHGESPPFVRRRPAIRLRRVPKTARPLRGSRVRRSVFIRVPGLAQQGHDLALAILPCDVEGRIAVLGSKSHIGAPFEKALGDREVAAESRAMQS